MYWSRILHGLYKQPAATEAIRKSHILYRTKSYPSHAIHGQSVAPSNRTLCPVESWNRCSASSRSIYVPPFASQQVSGETRTTYTRIALLKYVPLRKSSPVVKLNTTDRCRPSQNKHHAFKMSDTRPAHVVKGAPLSSPDDQAFEQGGRRIARAMHECLQLALVSRSRLRLRACEERLRGQRASETGRGGRRERAGLRVDTTERPWIQDGRKRMT